MKLYIDTTTDTGLWQWKLPEADPTQPHMIRVAAILETAQGEIADRMCRLVTPLPGWPEISPKNALMHGIDANDLNQHGCVLSAVLARIASLAARAGTLIAHNMQFHMRVLHRSFLDGGFPSAHVAFPLDGVATFCTMQASTNIVAIRLASQNRFKWPTLGEAYARFSREGLHLPADPIARGHALVDAVRVVHHGIIEASPMPAA